MAAAEDFADYEALLRRAGVRRSPNGSLMFEPGASAVRRSSCRLAHARLRSTGDGLLG